MPSSSQNQSHSVTDLAVETAIRLHGQGLRPIPVWGVTPEGTCACGKADCSGIGKHPVGGDWDKQRFANEDAVRAAFGVSEFLNVGLLFGEQDDGSWLLDVEADSPAAQKFMEDNGFLDIATVQWESSRGTHTLWRVSDAKDFNPPKATFHTDDDLEFRLGTRGGAACQSVVGGSFHKSGTPVRFVGDLCPGITPIAECPAELREIIASLFEGSKESKGELTVFKDEKFPEGRRNDSLAALAGKLVSSLKVNAWNRREMSEIVASTVSAQNFARCVPPLPDDEVSQIVKTAIGPWLDKEVATPSDLLTVEDLGLREAPSGGYEPDGDAIHVVEVDNFGSREFRIVCRGGFEVVVSSDDYWSNPEAVRKAFIRAIPGFNPPISKVWNAAWIGKSTGTETWDGLCHRLRKHKNSRLEHTESAPWAAAGWAIVQCLMDASDPPTCHHHADGSPILLDGEIAFIPATVKSQVRQQSSNEYSTSDVDAAWRELSKTFRVLLRKKEITFSDGGSKVFAIIEERSVNALASFIEGVSF